MRYELIEINGCDRFSVSGITGLRLQPKSSIQMILGKNGAGKSSLMELGFTPFAPSEVFFPNGGSWEVHIYHKGSLYKVQAIYGDKTRYSFKRDNEELNTSRNVTMQNDLIYQNLGITKDIQELLLGNIKLTELAPQARRDWMAKLSESDFTFAFKALKHFKQKQSYYQSVVAFLKKRINEENEKLIADEDLQAMMDRSKELHAKYDELQQTPQYPDAEPVSMDRLYECVRALEEDTLAFLAFDPVSPSYESMEALKSVLEDKLKDGQVMMGRIEQIMTDVDDLNQAIGRIENLLGEDFEKLRVLEKDINTALGLLPETSEVPENFLQPAGKAIESIRYVLTRLPSEILSEHDAALLIQKHSAENAKLDKAKQALEQIVSNLSVIEDVKTVACPSCHHQFKPGVDPELFEKLHVRRQSGLDYIEQQLKVVADADEALEQVRLQNACKQELDIVRSTYIREYPGLFGYLDSIDKWGVGKTMDLHLRMYESAYTLHHKRQHLIEQLDVISKAVENQAAYNSELPSLCKRLQEHTAKLQEVRAAFETNTQETDRLKGEYQTLVGMEREYQEILNKEERLYTMIDRYAEYRHNQQRAEALKAVTTNIAILENAINDNDVVKTSIRDFEKSLEEVRVMELGAKAIVDEMSPKTGLIAEQIREQIGTVLATMNQVIRKIWGYDIRVSVGEVNDGGLDYKFPLHVGATPRRDISEGSSSMKEIINRAFVLTAVVCLEMKDYPLFQDEPAITFDTEHGLRFIPMIKELVETDKFSQLVIISHDVDTQTAFPSADVTLLGDLKLPHLSNYNQHVEFFYGQTA